jgi:peptide/nickel transport system permease protein
MLTFIIRRVLLGILTVWIISFTVFSFMQLVPGDPVYFRVSQQATQGEIDQIRHEFWLDRPFLVQYGHWVDRAVHGDFGRSIVNNQKITDTIAKRLPITLYYCGLAFVFSTILGVAAGIVCAVRRGGILDSLITLFANIGIAVPIFWLGILGIYYIGYKLQWLPLMDYVSPMENLWESIRHAVMPVICLAIPNVAGLIRQTRSSMLEVIRQDYVRTAWSKGLRERTVIMRHALKNSLIPVVTMMSFFAAILFAGSVLEETVFNIPGMGRFIAAGAQNKDFPTVQAGVLLISLIVIAINLIVDIIYGWIDPRIRYK